MTHSYVWHDSFIRVTWPIHMCHMTHSYVWHDSFTCVAWIVYMCDMTHSYLRYDPSISVHVYDMTHSYVVTWLMHVCDMTRSCTCDTTLSHVWHNSFTRVWRLIHTSDMTHSYVWHDSFIYATWLTHTCGTYEWVMSHIWMFHIIHSYAWRIYVWHNSFICVTWLHYILCVTWLIIIRICVTHMNEWCETFILCVTWLIHSYAWHIWMSHETCIIHMRDMTFHVLAWLIYMCDMSPSYVWYDSLMGGAWLIHKCDFFIHMCDMIFFNYIHDMTHSYVWHDL